MHERITSVRLIGSWARVLIAGAATVALLSTGCGGEDGSPPAAVTTGVPASVSPPTQTLPHVTAAAPPATSPPATGSPPAPTGATPGPKGTPGGDEEGVRVPAVFQITAGAATPPAITVPPFLRVELRVRSADGAAHRVVLRTAPAVTLQVPPQGTVTSLVSGLSRGDYALDVDGHAGAAALHVADEPPGP